MKKFISLLLLMSIVLATKSQTCEELIKFVKANGYGTNFISYNSEAITKVTFYQITINYSTEYYAIVCFKQKYSYNCKEYIYQVASNTRLNYSMNYLNSAGNAFWKYIHPYRKVLGCSPEFED